MRGALLAPGAVLAMLLAAPAQAQTPGERSVQSQLDEAMALIRAQRAELDAQKAQIDALRARLDGAAPASAAATALPPGPAPAAVASTAPAPLERVGEAPADEDRPIELAVLEGQGSIITRRGQLSGDLQFDYARSDRSRAVFRGIELVEAVLVGVFDINENRQDVLTASASLRYGLTNRLEVGVRLPFVYRADSSIIAPVSGSTNNDQAATIDSSVKGHGLGDIEVSARYQLLDGRVGSPYLIANLQAVIPTGTDPFAVPRDELGRALRASTGAGFYGVSPSVTAILPSDPVVLFATLGYTLNFGKSVTTQIPPVIIDYVDPGDAIAASAGIGISFNQRTTLNLGYAHSWAFGTMTRTRLIEPTPAWPGMREARSRELQIGRLLMGVTYRVTDRASINWAVEIGATEDATDMRTTLRIPLVLITGR